jgi:dienelactone hydrolase
MRLPGALVALLVWLALPPVANAAPLVREAELLGGIVSVRAEIPSSPAGPRPAVVALIGNSAALIDAGFAVVTYTVHWDVLRRGEPTAAPAANAVGKWVLAAPSAAVLGERYLRDVVATATTYVPAVIDWLALQPEVDAARVGMAGGSTNGFVALQAAADSRLRAVVAIAACGDFPRFLRGSSMGMAGAELTLAPAYARWIGEQQLVAHPARVVRTAILMINRVADPLIPVACADETARVLTAAYAAAEVPQRFHYERLAAEGHGIGEGEFAAALAWLTRWLMPGQ